MSQKDFFSFLYLSNQVCPSRVRGSSIGVDVIFVCVCVCGYSYVSICQTTSNRFLKGKKKKRFIHSFCRLPPVSDTIIHSTRSSNTCIHVYPLNDPKNQDVIYIGAVKWLKFEIGKKRKNSNKFWRPYLSHQFYVAYILPNRLQLWGRRKCKKGKRKTKFCWNTVIIRL